MNRTLLFLAGMMFLSPLTLWSQETEIRFVAQEPSPVFRITSVVVENSGLSLTTDLTEVLRKMELLTIAPSTVQVPNGDLWLSWGGTEDFSRTFAIRAEGTPLEVRFSGSRPAALWSAYSAGLGALGFLASASLLSAQGPWPAVPAASAALACGGLLGVVLFLPRVEVR